MLGPGTYCVETGDFTGTAMEKKRKGPNWERAFHVATMANIPHILYKEKWEHRRALVRKLNVLVFFFLLGGGGAIDMSGDPTDTQTFKFIEPTTRTWDLHNQKLHR